jgi:hypothetical protein
MVEMCCSRDGPKEDASTSDDDKEAEGSGEKTAVTEYYYW